MVFTVVVECAGFVEGEVDARADLNVFVDVDHSLGPMDMMGGGMLPPPTGSSVSR